MVAAVEVLAVLATHSYWATYSTICKCHPELWPDRVSKPTIRRDRIVNNCNDSNTSWFLQKLTVRNSAPIADVIVRLPVTQTCTIWYFQKVKIINLVSASKSAGQSPAKKSKLCQRLSIPRWISCFSWRVVYCLFKKPTTNTKERCKLE